MHVCVTNHIYEQLWSKKRARIDKKFAAALPCEQDSSARCVKAVQSVTETNPRGGGSHLSDSVVLKPCQKRNGTGMTGCSFEEQGRHTAPNPRADAALAALGERGGVGAEAGPQAALRRRDFLVQMNWADLRLANQRLQEEMDDASRSLGTLPRFRDLRQLDVPACRYI